MGISKSSMGISKKSNRKISQNAEAYCMVQKFGVPLPKKLKERSNMGLLDNYTGIGMSPRPKWQHQGIIRRALYFAYDELERQRLFMLSEATVTNNWDDLAPDLVIFNERHEPLSIIEITTHKECSAIIKKCYDLIARFPYTEYFVYDYERDILYAYEGVNTDTWVTSQEFEITSIYLSKPLLNYMR